jgi:hypothetical protein
MDRVMTLIEKLNDQISKQESVNELLHTVQLIHHELQYLQSSETASSSSIAFHAPVIGVSTKEIQTQDKITVPLDIKTEDVEAELEQIRLIAEANNNVSIKNRRTLVFDPIEDTPTLSKQMPIETPLTEEKTATSIQEILIDSEKPETIGQTGTSLEVNQLIAKNVQSDSINEKLNQPQKDLSDRLQETPIKDLKKAIGINDRFLFIQELFKGDESMYERSLKTINGFSIYPEAEYWIRRELKTKLGWDDKNEAVQLFNHLVKRRFSSI